MLLFINIYAVLTNEHIASLLLHVNMLQTLKIIIYLLLQDYK